MIKYSLSSKEVTVDASEFICRYRDVERFGALCAQCPSYGKVWSCPPFDFDPRERSDGFDSVTVFATTITFDEATRHACSTPDEASRVGREAMQEAWQSLLPRLSEMERQSPGSRCFTFRCSLCPEGCTRPEGYLCRHPDRLRQSLEAVGFDIGAMMRDLFGIELEWSSDGSLPEHITLVTALMKKITPSYSG